MSELVYLMSGNIDPARDTDKFHLDMLNEVQKACPKVLLFATASTGTDWHNRYVENISDIFKRYNCEFEIIENPEAEIISYLKDTDIIYFLGGSPYKHTQLSRYREDFRKIPVKAGTSAGAIYLAHPVFYFQKDDYIVSVPEMLGFSDLHILPHSETHQEELVCSYLAHEAKISFARFYNQVCLKIARSPEEETMTALMGETPGSQEQIDFFFNNGNYFRMNRDGELKR